MKKLISIILILSLCLFGCAKKTDEPLKIVTTNFAAYDFARQVLGDEIDSVNLTLLGHGTKPHTYLPTEQDKELIKDCDVFIYVGDESWTDSISFKDGAQKLCLLDSLDKSNILTFKSGEVDSHVWLSIENAQILSNLVCDKLKVAKPEKEVMFADNLEAFALQLVSLDRQYKELMQNEQNGTIVVCDKFPFSYLTNDYNIGWYGAFADCTQSNEVSASTVSSLATAVDGQHLKNVVITEFSGDSLAKAVISKTADQNIGIVTLNSMHSPDINSTYVDIAKANLNSLKTAFETK